MQKEKLKWVVGAAAASLAMLAFAYQLGYRQAPREILDSEARSAGLFGKETRRVLSATVTSLRTENRMVVYQYTGETRVSVDRTAFGGLLTGSQELIVPATVTYHLDLSELDLEDVDFEEKSKIVRVKLPELKIGDVAFQPERARQINGGLLTLSDKVVQELTQVNYSTARTAFIKQAQQAEVIKAAKAQAERNTQKYFEIPLRIVGSPDIAVRAYFPDVKSAG